MADEVMITMDDVRKAGHCAAGAKAWFTEHGFDMKRIVQGGIPLSEFDGIDDANFNRVISAAQQRVAAD